MFHLGVVLLLFLSSSIGLSICDDPEDPHRIVGGSPTTIDKYPHMLSLEVKRIGSFIHMCGASIISRSWALTAAHCVDQEKMNEIRLRAGSSYREKHGQVHLPKSVIKHPAYDDRVFDYDLAVIQVSSPFLFSDKVKAIFFCSKRPAVRTPVTLTGWGRLSETGPKAFQLQVVELNIIDSHSCLSFFPENNTIPKINHLLCASVPGHIKSTCYADSGSPLISDEKLVGVTFTGSCGGTPAGFMDVSSFRQWIFDTTRPN